MSIPAGLRRLVRQRADGRCEYCLLPEPYAFQKHEPDHVVASQHDGETDEENLTLACFLCNRHKGPNVGSFDPATGQLTPFYHPRKDVWSDHFEWDGPIIRPRTAEGRVTIKILRFNDPVRVEQRQQLMAIDPAAMDSPSSSAS